MSPYVYAIGRIELRFPRPSVEREFAQVTGRPESVDLTDRKLIQRVLSDRQNRYLARQLCWVFTIGGLETYILSPRDPGDVESLIASLRTAPSSSDMDVVIGLQGPMATVSMCNGLVVPIVLFDQIYSFDRKSLAEALVKETPRLEKVPPKEVEQVFDAIMQVADNTGATDEHRALNYLAVRYPAIYVTAAEALARNSSLTAIRVQPSPLSGVHKLLDVIFSYTNRSTDVTEKFFTRVDVTDEFPFLVNKLSPYYDR